MNARYAVLAVVVAAFAGVAVLKGRDRAPAAGAPPPTAGLPRFVELGSDTCAACKDMEPVLDELRRDHSAALDVVFIDVWKDPERAEPFRVRVIPTQVFQGRRSPACRRRSRGVPTRGAPAGCAARWA